MKDREEERTFRIRRNLQDAGCGQTLATRFLDLEKSGCRCEQYRLLACHKGELLQQLHRIQYQIDCLDHLVYTMHQEEEKARGVPRRSKEL